MNRAKPEVTIELDKPRTLSMSLNAMVRFEQATGKNLLDQKAMQSMTATDLRALLWACLKDEDTSIKQDHVGGLIHPGNLEYVGDCVAQLWETSVPESEGNPTRPGQTPNG